MTYPRVQKLGAPPTDWRSSLPPADGRYSYAFLDEGAKREIRRRMLKAVAIPGCQVPFGSREMPIARGWGTGGLARPFASGRRPLFLRVSRRRRQA